MSYVTVIVDMQEDFFSHERLKNNRQVLTEKTNELASISRNSDVPVIWVKAEFSPDLSDAFIEVRKNNINIVVSGTPGAKFLSELVVNDTDSIVVKKRYSAFFGTSLEQTINALGCPTIIVAGVNTHACIRTTVIDAYQRDYEVILASECIDSYDSNHHDVSMEYMCGKIAIPKNNDQILELLQ